MWRMGYVSPRWISQLYVKALRDERTSGMSRHHTHESIPYYGIGMEANRYEAQWKNGLTLNAEHHT